MSLLAVGFAWDLGAPFSELFPGFPFCFRVDLSVVFCECCRFFRGDSFFEGIGFLDAGPAGWSCVGAGRVSGSDSPSGWHILALRRVRGIDFGWDRPALVVLPGWPQPSRD